MTEYPPPSVTVAYPSMACAACGYGCGCCCNCECQTPCPTPDEDGDCFCGEDCHGGHPLAECHNWSARRSNLKALMAARQSEQSAPEVER
jgi:hypothetical protein